MIKEIPKYERPREKMLKNGCKALSNRELLAIIIKSGVKGKSAIELADEILYSINSLNDLKDLELLELTKIKGLGNVKAMEILCAIELGKRIALEKNSKKRLTNSSEIYLAYKDYLLDFKVEHFIAIYFDSKCHVLAMKHLFSGDTNMVFAKPNEIFRYAIKIGAPAVVVMHNHPSGDSTPSRNDYEFTENLIGMAEATNILLLDHIIVGNSYYSFNDNGFIHFVV